MTEREREPRPGSMDALKNDPDEVPQGGEHYGEAPFGEGEPDGGGTGGGGASGTPPQAPARPASS